MKKSVMYVVAAVAVGVFSLLPLGAASKESKIEKTTITLSKSNLLVLNDEVNGQTVAAIMEKAKEIDSKPGSFMRHMLRASGKPEPIYLYLFTPGGEVQAGLELIEGLHGLKRPVNTITAFAASMGFQIAQNLGDRNILNSGILMSHHAVGGAEGQIGGAGTAQLNKRLGMWEQRMLEMDEQTVKRTNGKQTLKSYQEAYDHELWLTGTQSVQQGYADRVATVRCDETLDGYTAHQVEFLGVVITYDLSDCPLNTAPVNIRLKLYTTKGYMDLVDFQQIGGSFGSSCLQLSTLDKNKVCAYDVNLNLEKIIQARTKFLDRFTNLKDYVVPMTIK